LGLTRLQRRVFAGLAILGATRLSLSVVADQVLALRQPRRAKKATSERDARRPNAPVFDDSIPF
jgi:hypothetical protein